MVSSQTLHRHRNGGMRGEKWVEGEAGSCATAERRELKSECALGRIVSFQGQVTYIEFYEFRLSIQNKPNMNRLHCFFAQNILCKYLIRSAWFIVPFIKLN